MSSQEIDRTDMAILYLLQENARNHTTEAIAEKVGVSSTTVGTRIRNMEEEGIIKGYNPVINYERIGFDHHYVAICTVPLETHEEYTKEIIENVSGVVRVRKYLTTTQNLSVEIVSFNREKFEKSLGELIDLGININRFELVNSEESCPFNHFGKRFANG